MTDLASGNACINHPDIVEGIRRCSRCGRAFCSDCLVTIGGKDYCASCKNEQLLDVRSGVDSGVLPLASRGRRLAAAIVDSIPWVAIGMFIGFRAAFGGRMVSRWDPMILAFGFTYVIYDGLMIQLRSQTVGKMAVKIKVVGIGGVPVTAKQAWIRALSRWALNFLYVVDWLPIFFTDERLCVHDMLAKTRVVDTD